MRPRAAPLFGHRPAGTGGRPSFLRCDWREGAFLGPPSAPFLHNGSVPNLYELLSPVDERSETFYLGSRLFDPEKVGYETGPIDGGFLLDTTKPGNSNKGHAFEDGPRGDGVIGPEFTDLERRQLVEYLKSLDLSPALN